MNALTEERLNEIEADPIEACLTDDEITELIAAARANAKLVEALKEARGFANELAVAADDPDESEDAQVLMYKIDAALADAGVKEIEEEIRQARDLRNRMIRMPGP